LLIDKFKRAAKQQYSTVQAEQIISVALNRETLFKTPVDRWMDELSLQQ